jgi:tetratricopeptide (TPR) repeat protein
MSGAGRKPRQAYGRRCAFSRTFPTLSTISGIILYRLGRSAEAQRSYRAALCLRPEHPELHMSLGVTLLLAGQFEEGWKELEWRLQTKGMVGELSRFSVPFWNGEAIGDRVVLLHAE